MRTPKDERFKVDLPTTKSISGFRIFNIDAKYKDTNGMLPVSQRSSTNKKKRLSTVTKDEPAKKRKTATKTPKPKRTFEPVTKDKLEEAGFLAWYGDKAPGEFTRPTALGLFTFSQATANQVHREKYGW